jgi:hypothetical protein
LNWTEILSVITVQSITTQVIKLVIIPKCLESYNVILRGYIHSKTK